MLLAGEHVRDSQRDVLNRNTAASVKPNTATTSHADHGGNTSRARLRRHSSGAAHSRLVHSLPETCSATARLDRLGSGWIRGC